MHQKPAARRQDIKSLFRPSFVLCGLGAAGPARTGSTRSSRASVVSCGTLSRSDVITTSGLTPRRRRVACSCNRSFVRASVCSSFERLLISASSAARNRSRCAVTLDLQESRNGRPMWGLLRSPGRAVRAVARLCRDVAKLSRGKLDHGGMGG